MISKMVYDSYKIPTTEVKDVRDAFKYTALPTEQPSLRLLTIYPGLGVNPVECLLTAHTWDPETGSISRPEQAKHERGSSLISVSSSAIGVYCYVFYTVSEQPLTPSK
jgi:hypothetical protein